MALRGGRRKKNAECRVQPFMVLADVLVALIVEDAWR